MEKINYLEKEIISKSLETYLHQFIQQLIVDIEDSHNKKLYDYRSQIVVILNQIREVDLTQNKNEILEMLSSENIDLTNLKDFFDFYKLDYFIEDYEKEIEEEILRQLTNLIVTTNLLRLKTLIDLDSKQKDFDCFLSHCSWDSKEVLGIYLMIKYENKLKCYVDWIEDKQANLPRAITLLSNVIKKLDNVNFIRINNEFEKILKTLEEDINNNDEKISNMLYDAIVNSNSLIYVQSRHYDHSRWMPWELGIADTNSKSILRLPIKYIRKRKNYGKRSGFLIRYKSLEYKNGKLNI